MSARKHLEEIPNSSGIYQIRCNQNGKIYVGSAVSLQARWCMHRRELRRRLHHNPHLQHAWNLHGEASFEFTILELVEAPQLLIREQWWIIQTRSKGLGKLKSYKGWTHANSVRQREFIKTHHGFVDPDGRPAAPIRNLAAFCRERGLDKTHMVAVANARIVSHRGWTHARGRKRLPPVLHKGFIAPGGARTRITNLSAFCRACGLCVVHMHELKSGKRPSHKGWTWKHDADQALEW